MPAKKRHKTDKPGVYFIEGKNRITGEPTKAYYIKYGLTNGKDIEEKAGWAHEGMTAYKASIIRAKKINGDLPSNSERRAEAKAQREAKANRYPVKRLWAEYKASKRNFKGLATDECRYRKFIEPNFGEKTPEEIDSLSVERLKRNMVKNNLAPQTIKNTLELLKRIVNYGFNNNLSMQLPFKIKFPKCNNASTENLTIDQVKKLIEVILNDKHPIAGPMMLCALYTGMRRGEMFELKWEDLNFEIGFIKIRNPKGGIDQIIPMNKYVIDIFSKLNRECNYVFPGKNGNKRVDIKKAANRIKIEAGLSKEFRPFHGLRHVFASALANSGKVDMNLLRALLTHKSNEMTQRYAHLHLKALQNASSVITDIFPYDMADTK